MRLLKKNPLLSVIDGALVSYAVPSNINYLWGLGSLAGIILVLQIVSGVLLAMHYTPHIDYAFLSVEHIMRDVNYGWFLRYMHANGASMFFIIVYTHIGRGLYFGSYRKPREKTWLSGVVMFLLMMATAFMGYVLPWGQMSYWGATVITNLFSALPIVGKSIVTWLWGGFSVDNATLNRFFALHYLVPFLLRGRSLLHLTLLHENGSNNPLGVRAGGSKLPFYPYFVIKDIFGLALFLIFFSYWIFFEPNRLGHPDNYIPANPMVTPPHIVPEWYFLPFYAILRSIPDKLGGVLAMFRSIGILLRLPFITTPISRYFRPMYKRAFWVIVSTTCILGWIGSEPVEAPYVMIGQVATVIYFGYFRGALPLITRREKERMSY
jgi:quinol-cytochrome oxidoreductase complex cytochrome b subunit